MPSTILFKGLFCGHCIVLNRKFAKTVSSMHDSFTRSEVLMVLPYFHVGQINIRINPHVSVNISESSYTENGLKRKGFHVLLRKFELPLAGDSVEFLSHCSIYGQPRSVLGNSFTFVKTGV